MPSTQTAARPFDPGDYISEGTYLDLLAGLVDTLDRFDEIDAVTALRIPAFFMEVSRVGKRHGLQLLAPSSVAEHETEQQAVLQACCDVISRVEAAGSDVTRILQTLQDAMRPELEKCAAALLRQRRPGLLGRLLGR